MRRNARLLTLAAVLVVAGACAADGPDASGADGHAGSSDAGSPDGGSLDAPAGRNCTAEWSYQPIVLTHQGASGEGSSLERYNIEARGRLNQDAEPDILSALLYSNEGAFGDVIEPGIYDLSGDATSFSTCGLCILLDTDTQGPTSVTDVYMPTSGTFTITEAGSRFVAELTNGEFRHVLIDVSTFATTPHADGCTASIPSARFDADIINE